MPAMFKALTRTAAVTVLAAGLSACATGGTVMYDHIYNETAKVFFDGAARDGVVRTVVVGNAFDEPQATVVDNLNAAMEGSYIGRPAVFKSDIAAETPRDIRFVFLFDPPEAFHKPDICGDPANLAPGAPETGRLSLLGALCVDTAIQTSAHLLMPKPVSSADPAFDAAVGSVTRALIPPKPLDKDSPCTNPLC